MGHLHSIWWAIGLVPSKEQSPWASDSSFSLSEVPERFPEGKQQKSAFTEIWVNTESSKTHTYSLTEAGGCLLERQRGEKNLLGPGKFLFCAQAFIHAALSTSLPFIHILTNSGPPSSTKSFRETYTLKSYHSVTNYSLGL